MGKYPRSDYRFALYKRTPDGEYPWTLFAVSQVHPFDVAFTDNADFIQLDADDDSAVLGG